MLKNPLQKLTMIVILLLLLKSNVYPESKESNAYLLSWMPKEINVSQGVLELKRGDTKVLTDERYPEIDLLLKLFKRLANFEVGVDNVLNGKSINKVLIVGKSSNSIINKLLTKEELKIKEDEGYAIVVTENYFLIAFNSRRGFFYALRAVKEILLMSELRIRGKDNIYLTVPFVRINDFPSFNMRALHFTLHDISDISNLEIVKTLIDKASEYRFNTLILSINNAMTFEKFPSISRKSPFSKKQIIDLINYAKERHFEVIPELQTLGHQEWLLAPVFPDLILKKGILKDNPNMFLTYNPKKPEVYKIIFDIIDEIIDVFEPKYFHIGHDETFGLRVFDEPESYKLFAEDVRKLHDYLSSKGIKTMMWGDMLKKEHNGAPKSIYKAIDLIPKDVIIVDWIYRPQTDYPSIKYFTEKGFQVMGATFKNEKGIQSFSDFMKNFNPKPFGMVATTWYYLPFGKDKMLERLIEVSGKNFW